MARTSVVGPIKLANKMKKFKIDIVSGNVFLGDVKILPRDKANFCSVAGLEFVKKSDYSVNFTIFSNSQTVWGSYPFQAKVWFTGDLLHLFSLHWLDGMTKQKGWNSDESDLIHDKSSLTRLIKKIVGRDPDKTEEYEDIFDFDWGSIKVLGVRKAFYPKIDISWRP